MTVHCPHCLTGYLLPDHLVGDKGARVRCPGCEGVFVALPAAAGASGGAPVPAGPVPGASAPVPEEPSTVAATVLGVLADFLGDDLARSQARGTVLSDHGPAIMAAWDEYRRRVGAEAPALVFRVALGDRCGVDLSRADG